MRLNTHLLPQASSAARVLVPPSRIGPGAHDRGVRGVSCDRHRREWRRPRRAARDAHRSSGERRAAVSACAQRFLCGTESSARDALPPCGWTGGHSVKVRVAARAGTHPGPRDRARVSPSAESEDQFATQDCGTARAPVALLKHRRHRVFHVKHAAARISQPAEEKTKHAARPRHEAQPQDQCERGQPPGRQVDRRHSGDLADGHLRAEDVRAEP